jgi:nucleoside-diphosphate-sugar epimerase
MKYRHIIITGAAGFIGSQVALEFSKKAEKITLLPINPAAPVIII